MTRNQILALVIAASLIAADDSSAGYVLGDPINNIDPSGLTTTVVTTYDYGFGSHSALLISTPGKPPFLYDPAGSFPKNGSGDFAEGITLEQYVQYQKSTGSSVQVVNLNTTSAQEADIIMRALGQPNAAPFQCAISASGALGGVCGIPGSMFPGRLNRQAQQASCPNGK